MKKILILAVAAMAVSSVFAAPYWMLVNTAGAKAETVGDFSYYTAFYCSQDKAAELFGGKTASGDITAYLKNNWVDLETELEVQTMEAYGFDEGEFSFSRYFQTKQENMVAIVTYSGSENLVRVFDGQEVGSNGVLFDGDAAGAWTARAIPEPTSGLLLLLGVAGLALKRKAFAKATASQARA